MTTRRGLDGGLVRASFVPLLAVMLASAALSGCLRTAPSHPDFPRYGGPTPEYNWHSTEVSASVPATEAARLLSPMADTPGAGVRYVVPIYAPAPRTVHVTWDSLLPTGEFCVAKDVGPQTGQDGSFGMRVDSHTGTWSYNVDNFYGGFRPYVFAEGFKATNAALHGTPHETRFVPTDNLEVQWMMVRTASGRVFASPVNFTLGGQPWPYVDGRGLDLGQLLPPDTILHGVVYDSSKRSPH